MTPHCFSTMPKILLICLLGSVAALAQENGEKEAGDAGLTLLKTIETTLSNNPAIAIQKQQVALQEGALKVQSGTFDTVLQSGIDVTRSDSPLKQAQITNSDHLTSESQTVSVGASKLFRSGLSVSPTVQTSRVDSGVDGDTIATTTDLVFTVAYPLLNGRGHEVTGAGEMAAKSDLEAAFHSLNHTISGAILSSGRLYWSYLASYRSLEILRESESHAKQLVEDVQKLIDADQMPANEILQLKANLADKRANRISGELALKQNRETLGVALGLDPEIIRQLPIPSDNFPDIDAVAMDQLDRVAAYIDFALDRRGDLLANYQTLQSSQILLGAARNGLKPNLDLVVSAGYQALEEGSNFDDWWAGIYNNIPGPTASISLSYQFPLRNQQARGQLAQNKAIYDQTQIRTQELKRQISSDVLLALENVRHSILSLRQAQIATSTYQLAVENERKKLQLGFSTLLDVISSEDRLRNAHLNLIALKQQFGAALLEIRFQIGSLIQLNAARHHLTSQDLTTFPNLD